MSSTESSHALDAPAQETVSQLEQVPEAGRPLGAELLGWTFAQTLRAMYSTWRKNLEEVVRLEELHERGEPYIVSFWHRKYVAMFPMMLSRQICAVTTASPHGHVVASICRFFGHEVIQIPSQADAAQSMQMIGHAVAHIGAATLAVDGPTGPDHKVKRGAIQLASELGYTIVPASVASRHKHVLRHRWDQLEIPMLFTRVHACVGEPIRIPRGLGWEEVQYWRDRLRDALEAVDQEAERRVRQS